MFNFAECYNLSMIIREYEIKDREQIKALLVELQEYVVEIDKFNLNMIADSFKVDYFKFMMRDCAANKGKVFVAEDEQKVVGFIAGFVQTYDERDKLDYSCPKKGIIAELIVSKNSRNNGAGKLLLDKMEDYFKSINCEFVQLDVFSYNDSAKKFYAKNNYEERIVTLFKKL